jgi:hypothetical protein
MQWLQIDLGRRMGRQVVTAAGSVAADGVLVQSRIVRPHGGCAGHGQAARVHKAPGMSPTLGVGQIDDVSSTRPLRTNGSPVQACRAEGELEGLR